MKTSQSGIELIKSFEGCRLEAYKCPAGIWTIGYGHTAGVEKGQKITQEQAETFLKQDLKRFENVINEVVRVAITQNQFDALVSFTYNVGIGALKTSTLLRLLNSADYIGAAEQFDRWVFAGQIKLAGLVRRRKAERELFSESLKLGKQIKVIATALNVRAGAGTKFKVVKVLSKGTITRITSIKDGWGQLADGSGWISLNYVQYV